MFVLKVNYIKIKCCETNQIEEVEQITSKVFGNTSIERIVTKLFFEKEISYNEISRLTVPDDTGNIYCDRILKAMRFSQRYKSNIVFMNDLEMIPHPNDN